MAAGTRDYNRYKQAAQRFASGFSRGQQAVTIAAVIGIVVVAMIFMSLSGRPTYAMLFTNLQPTDAAAITQQLATNHIPYQLQSGGSTILVPQNMVDQERLAAAAAGLPSQTTVGLSILDKAGLTTSQLTQQADYLQALQGELEQTIDSISGVTSSQVSIALPANQTFALGNTNPTGASVLVDLQPGHSLTYGQVQAIVSLTASAVPGLNRGQVTLADSSGNLLAGPGVNDSGAAQSSASSAYDSAAEARISAYLAAILGPGNADVQVNAQLNFNQVQTHSQVILSGKGGKPLLVCTSTQQSSEKYTGTGTPAGLQAGTTTGGNGNYTQTSTSKTCESGTQSQTVTIAPGGVTSQSIAVLVNSKALPKGLTLARLQAGVAAAAGIQKARGDVLSFSAAAFKTNPAAVVATTKKSILTTALKPGVALLLVLLVLLLLWRASRKARKAAAAEQALLDSLVLEQLDSMPMLMEPTTGELPAIELTSARRRLGPSIQELVDNQSDEVASVLRDWLHQGT